VAATSPSTRNRAQQERYDGLFVLRTDTDHDAETMARVYKMLWMVEDTFRTAKSILETRLTFHKCDETIHAHVFCSFLALCLKRELDIRMAGKACIPNGPRSCPVWTTSNKSNSSAKKDAQLRH
jgi:transposase